MRLLPTLLIAAACFGQTPEPVRPTAVEKAIVQELSEARWRPKVYVKHLKALREYFDGKVWRLPDQVPLRTQEGVAALDEAIAFLESASSAGPLRFNEGLWQAARELAQDQARTGGVGHVGSQGSRLRERLDRQGTLSSTAGECISYGPEDPRMIVLQLLIDDGVPDRGHRRTIFNPDLHQAGAALASHAQWGQVCVVDFADGFLPNRPSRQ
ncbi:MAG TPA: CAP domain-containing protein [Holophagaceae bacterium]|nr:CAP domain-containing protein [Holophagaceae bacterium]